MSVITESVVEEAALAWLEDLGYAVLHGPDIATGMLDAERSDPIMPHHDVSDPLQQSMRLKSLLRSTDHLFFPLQSDRRYRQRS